MSRMITGGLLTVTLLLASQAQAGERVTLTEWQLDGVTAGAFTGITASSQARSGCCSGSSGIGTDSDYLIGTAVPEFEGNSGSAQQQGRVRTIAGKNFSFTLGVVQGTTETTGNGTATNTAQGVAEGDFTFATGGLQNVGSNRQFGVIVALAVDNPFRASAP